MSRAARHGVTPAGSKDVRTEEGPIRASARKEHLPPAESDPKSAPQQNPPLIHHGPSQGRGADLVAFLVLIAFGGALVVFGHQSAPELAASGAVVTSMYAAWRYHR